MSQPRVSVIIPVFNGAKYLAEALHSVMAQTLPPVEIIVVDDGSSDDSAQVARSFGLEQHAPLKVIRQENQGPSAARNHGLRLSSGERIAFLDADDLWEESHLQIQTALLDAHPQAQLAWGVTQVFTTEGGQRIPLGQPINRPNLGSYLFHYSVFEQAGGFDENLRISEDMDLFNRIEERGLETLRHPDLMLWYRYHGENTWLGQSSWKETAFLSIRLRMERRRAGVEGENIHLLRELAARQRRPAGSSGYREEETPG